MAPEANFFEALENIGVERDIAFANEFQVLTFPHCETSVDATCHVSVFHHKSESDDMIDQQDQKSKDRNNDTEDESEPQDDESVLC